jgi:hypothetical protein
LCGEDCRRSCIIGRIPRTAIATFVLFAAVCAIYLPDVGHGFIRDDVGWVGPRSFRFNVRKDGQLVFSLSDAVNLLTKAHAGQFRPAVSASFALERRACGINSFCYGLTNFVLLIACAAAIVALAQALSLPPGAALVAGAIWVFNWHGISSAVLWISGRSALLLVLFAALGGAAFVRGRWLWAAVFAGAAMLSKEEAVLLPAALLGWALVEHLCQGRPLVTRRNVCFAMASCIVGGVYYLLRSHSGALTASSAPPYYRLDVSVTRLLSNGPEYLDRSLTFAAALLLLFWLAYRPSVRALLREHRLLLWFAFVWWVCGFAITMFIPVRSSLYACGPSIGFSIAAAAMLGDAWSLLDDRQRLRAIRTGLAIPLVLWPVYHLRNKDLVDATDVSARLIAAVQRVAEDKGANTVVALKDDRSHRASFDTALGTGVQEAVDLLVSPRVAVWMDPPPQDAALGGISLPPAHPDATLRLSDGRVVQEE